MHRLAPVALLALGCASSPYDHAWISRDLARRTGHAVGPQRPTEAPSVPRGVSLDDGLTAEETVALALWNNPRFHGDLAQLGFSRADLEEAGQLPNPLLTLMLPIGAHPLSFRVQAPLEALWQRGRRVAAAQRDVERVARSLVQTGLDLARDARLAHADLVLAEERLRVRTAADETLAAIIEITRLRAAAGDVGDAELESARAEALTARDAFLRAQADAQIARVAFRAVVGFAADPRPLRAVAAPPDEAPSEPLADVVRFARSARPDLRAAELAVEAAAARAGWERTRIISFTAALDAVTLNPIDGLAVGPGIIAPIPIFNFNQGAIGRAEAEIEQASWRAIALRQQVVTDVSQAHAQLAQARESLARWRAEVVPSLERSVQFGTEQFTAGEASYLAVLDATRRAIDGRLRVAELEADVRRALAQRDRSAGGTPR
jgi:cobalt-zinc-cadmium efflux system outer membrane protein